MKMRQPDKERTHSSSPSTTPAAFPVNKPKADMSGIHLLAIRTKVRRRDSILMPLELLEELRILLHAFCKVETGSDLCQPSFGCLTPQQLALILQLCFTWLLPIFMAQNRHHDQTNRTLHRFNILRWMYIYVVLAYKLAPLSKVSQIYRLSVEKYTF